MPRVWDQFLTEQDRANLDVRPSRSREHRGKRPCLLLIDLYRGAFGDRPLPLNESVKDWPNSCGLAGWEALPYIQRLLGEARRVGMPVIHTTGDALTNVGQWSRHQPPSGIREERWRSRYDIVDEVMPLDGEVTLRKLSPSPFWGTPLTMHLNRLGIDTIFVVGESTSGCVRATVVDAVTHRYDVVVVEEAVFDRHQFTHAANLFDMSEKYADVVPLDQALEMFPSMMELAPVH